MTDARSIARREVEIINRLGLHARAAARFVAVARYYTSDVHIYRAERTVNGKSIMGVMMLAAAQGSHITIETEGDDATEALDALMTLVANRFGEDE